MENANSVDPSGHSIDKDRERIESYQARMDRFKENELVGKRGKGLDVAAANRFITHALPELTKEQKAKLKEVSDKYAREAIEGEVDEILADVWNQGGAGAGAGGKRKANEKDDGGEGAGATPAGARQSKRAKATPKK